MTLLHPGAHPDADGTCFAVVAPAPSALLLCLTTPDGERQVPMTRGPGHLWSAYVPGVGPGQRYGYRVPGVHEDRLLLDPNAHRLTGDLRIPTQDRPGSVPLSVVVAPASPEQDHRPHTPWRDTVVYELHVRGFTKTHPDVPEHLRGTYAGLAHPSAIAHLVSLGVTAVELLPVAHFVDEPHLQQLGLTNYWGYNPVAFAAPHEAYAATDDPVTEFRDMVRTLHAAGLEVLLDVVVNHTGEGDAHGPVLSWKALDPQGAYRHAPDGSYEDVTGCGATVDTRTPHVLRTVTDALRWWATTMQVDGFRFDLAPALDRGGAFLQTLDQDPVLGHLKLIAEPWDLGPDGYRIGRFPHPWAEWNGRFRDDVRDFWAGGRTGPAQLATRLCGSPDLYDRHGRAAWASVNLVTAHDGFTLRDLTTYAHKRNLDNGEDGRDGEQHNHGWDCGVDGETDDAQVNALRLRQAANLLSTLLLSRGVPMLAMGDEVRRTQQGNNNAYCQDGPVSWQPWKTGPDAAWLGATIATLVALRREAGIGTDSFPGPEDITWFGPGGPLAGDGWDGACDTLGMLLPGRLVVILHRGAQEVQVPLPDGTSSLVLDTSRTLTGDVRGCVRVSSHSVVVLRPTAASSRPVGHLSS